MTAYLNTESDNHNHFGILSVEELREKFNKDYSLVSHNDSTFCLWMNTHCNPAYQELPNYIPFETDGCNLDTNNYIVDDVRPLATMLYQMDGNLDDLFADEPERNVDADEAVWTITFTRKGKSYSATIPWLAQNYEVMDETIHGLIEAAMQ